MSWGVAGWIGKAPDHRELSGIENRSGSVGAVRKILATLAIGVFVGFPTVDVNANGLPSSISFHKLDWEVKSVSFDGSSSISRKVGFSKDKFRNVGGGYRVFLGACGNSTEFYGILIKSGRGSGKYECRNKDAGGIKYQYTFYSSGNRISINITYRMIYNNKVSSDKNSFIVSALISGNNCKLTKYEWITSHKSINGSYTKQSMGRKSYCSIR